MRADHRLLALDEGESLCLRLLFHGVCREPNRHKSIESLRTDVWQVRVPISALEALFEALPSICVSNVPKMADHLAAIVTAVVDCDCWHEESRVALTSSRATAMRHFFLANLERPDLGVIALRAEFHASRATVYGAFDEVGGVARFFRENRSDAVCRDLSTTQPHWGAIRTIAGRCGFMGQTSFLWMFRTCFCTRPTEVLGSAFRAEPHPPAAVSNHLSDGLPRLASFWTNCP